MLKRNRSPFGGDGVLFVERANELAVCGKVNLFTGEAEAKASLHRRRIQSTVQYIHLVLILCSILNATQSRNAHRSSATTVLSLNCIIQNRNTI